MILEKTSLQDLLESIEKVFVDEYSNFKEVEESRRDSSEEAESSRSTLLLDDEGRAQEKNEARARSRAKPRKHQSKPRSHRKSKCYICVKIGHYVQNF